MTVKTGYLHTPNGTPGGKVQPISNVLRGFTAERFVDLSEQQARQAAADARLAEIESAAAKPHIDELSAEQVEYPEYQLPGNAKAKAARYERHLENRMREKAVRMVTVKAQAVDRLTEMIQTTLDAAQLTGSVSEQHLWDGLYLHVRPRDDGALVITLWRQNAQVLPREWNTVIAFWPIDLGPINWSLSGMTDKGRYYRQVTLMNGMVEGAEDVTG